MGVQKSKEKIESSVLKKDESKYTSLKKEKKKKFVNLNQGNEPNFFYEHIKETLFSNLKVENLKSFSVNDSGWVDDFLPPDPPDRISDVETEIDKSKLQVNVLSNYKSNHLTRNIFQFLRHSELTKQPKKLYLELNQIEIDSSMRSTLIDWMIMAAEEFKLKSETLMLSVRYVYRYLSETVAKDLVRSKLQLVGATALLIASKYEELNAPLVDDLVDITDNSYKREELLLMEWEILDTLLYETSHPTISSFIPRILKGNQILIRENEEMQISSLCAYLAELSILDYYASTTYLPSMIAASCVLLANFILCTNKPSWTHDLMILSGNYRSSQLQDCCIIIYECLKRSIRQENTFSSIREKYSTSKFLSISMNNDVKRFVYTFKTLPSFLFVESF